MNFIRDVALLAISLRQHGLETCGYHGDKMTANDKQKALENWKEVTLKFKSQYHRTIAAQNIIGLLKRDNARIRKSVELSLLILKLRSLGWKSWKVVLILPGKFNFSRSYDLRERKHQTYYTSTARQELEKLTPQLDCLSDILSTTMSSLVRPNGGQTTTINQSASSRSSLAASRVLHSSSYVTLSNSQSKSKAVSYSLTPSISSCLLISAERTSTHPSLIQDVLLSKDIVPMPTKYSTTKVYKSEARPCKR